MEVIKIQPASAQPGVSAKRYSVGTYWLISKYGRITKYNTYNNQLPCCVFFAVLLLIVSFILTTPLSLLCTVPFLVCISKVIIMLVYKECTVCTVGNFMGSNFHGGQVFSIILTTQTIMPIIKHCTTMLISWV